MSQGEDSGPGLLEAGERGGESSASHRSTPSTPSLNNTPPHPIGMANKENGQVGFDSFCVGTESVK
jgi:hypothetical protein